MIYALQILIPTGWIFAHLTRPTEIRLMLDLLQDFVYGLLECYIHPLYLTNGVLHPCISSMPLLEAPSPVLPLVLKRNRGLPFIL